MRIRREQDSSLLLYGPEIKTFIEKDGQLYCQLDSDVLSNIKVDSDVEVKLTVVRKKKEKVVPVKKPIIERTAEQVYHFDCCEPTYEEWVKAGIELGYGEDEDDFEYYDYQWHRGDFDYTR